MTAFYLCQNHFRFPGQYYDSETGLHFNWHRYYDPETGRYISADPIGLNGGVNLYGYVRGNPVNGIDPFGLFVLNPVSGGIGGTVVCGPVCGAVGAIAGGLAVALAGQVIMDSLSDDTADDAQDITKDAICDEDPDDLCEQYAFAEAKAGAGRVIMTSLGDEPRLIAHYGPGPWVKKQHTKNCPGGKKITIHYFHSISSGVNVELKKVHYGGGVHSGGPGIVE